MSGSSWFKVDSDYPTHPKFLALGNPLAEAMFFRMLAYCSQHLTDGFVPTAFVARQGDFDDPIRVAEQIVTAGLTVTVTGGYAVNNYAEHQRTRSQAEAERAGWRERKGRQRERERENGAVEPKSPNGHDKMSRRDNGVTSAGLTAESRDKRQSERQSEIATVPVALTRAKRAPAKPIESADDWSPNDKHAAYCAEHGLNLDALALAFRGYTLNRKTPYKNLDAGFQTWIANEVARDRSTNGNGRASTLTPRMLAAEAHRDESPEAREARHALISQMTDPDYWGRRR